MSTLYDPDKIRALADTGDPFWKGAAWILGQQDAARIDATDYDAGWAPTSADWEEHCRLVQARLDR